MLIEIEARVLRCLKLEKKRVFDYTGPIVAKPQLRLYNTLSRQLEAFKPLKPTSVGLYTCGPTVYNFAHLGNFRTFIFEDLLERALAWEGYHVKRVMNITDVGHLTGDSDTGEDKVEKEAKFARASVQDVVKLYTKAFVSDAKRLNIKIPKTLAPASKFVPEQIKLIQLLFKKGLAYDTPRAVYFDVSKFPPYGKLSGQRLADKAVGARDEVVQDSEKHHPADFALWFKAVGKFEHHILRWKSPWGVGFPGWHVECSAISTKFLGQPFDIHTGGVDHIGTHHTNEMAQSEGAYGKPLARYWLHGEFFLVDSAKMAKSEGNFLTLKDVLDKNISPLAFRYLMLLTHYRSPLNFSWVALEQAKNGLQNLIQRVFFLQFLAKNIKHQRKPGAEVIAYRARFADALRNDLNVPQALAVAQEMLKDKALALREPKNVLALLYDFDEVFGLRLRAYGTTSAMGALFKDKHLAKLVAEREEFRRLQQFIQADRLRKKIEGLGYVLEDTPVGPFVAPKTAHIGP